MIQSFLGALFCRRLFHNDHLDRAFIGGLLDDVFQFGGYNIGDHFGDIITQMRSDFANAGLEVALPVGDIDLKREE